LEVLPYSVEPFGYAKTPAVFLPSYCFSRGAGAELEMPHIRRNTGGGKSQDNIHIAEAVMKWIAALALVIGAVSTASVAVHAGPMKLSKEKMDSITAGVNPPHGPPPGQVGPSKPPGQTNNPNPGK
jgi:hypothetical protein